MAEEIYDPFKRETFPIKGDLTQDQNYGAPLEAVPKELLYHLLDNHSFGDRNGDRLAIEDNLSSLRNGETYSPLTVRAISHAIMHGLLIPDQPKLLHRSKEFINNTAVYAYFCGFISAEEYNYYVTQGELGHKITSHLPEDKSDSILQKDSVVSTRKVFGTIEQAILDKVHHHPRKKLLLINGKWNGVPHPGYIFTIMDALTWIKIEEGIPEEDVYILIVGDSNRSISHQGKGPFISTMMRLSLMSYLPHVNAVAVADFNGEGDINDYWINKMLLARPDYLTVEYRWKQGCNGNWFVEPSQEFRKRQATAVGATVVPHLRAGTNILANPEIKEQLPNWLQDGSLLSSTSIQHGLVGSSDDLGHIHRKVYDTLFIHKKRLNAQGWPPMRFDPPLGDSILRVK